MRKSLLFAAILTAISTVACQRTEMENETPARKVNMKVSAVSTKTVLSDDESSILWEGNSEQLLLIQDADGDLDHMYSAEGETSDGGQTMSFNVSLDEKVASSYTYCALYSPSFNEDAALSELFIGGTQCEVLTPTIQFPSYYSFDRKADLLVAAPETVASQPTSLNMCFARKVALVRMGIQGLSDNKVITSIKFEAPNKVLSGKSLIDFNTGAFVEIGYRGDAYDYIEAELSECGFCHGAIVYFCCLPCNLVAGDSFTVTVTTTERRYTKTVNLTGSQVLQFKAGDMAKFSVEFYGIEGETL